MTQFSTTETNESIIELLIIHFFPLKNRPPLPTLQQVKFRNHFLLYWNECVALKHISSPALISHKPFSNPSFQAILFRCMIVFEIPASINHCSVTCFTLYLLSSFSSVLDCQCCVNCLHFWCSICSEFWQAPTKRSQLTFGQKYNRLFLLGI